MIDDEQSQHLWRPCASMEAVRARAKMLAAIRHFFLERDVLEVETPVLSKAGTTDPHIESFQTEYCQPGSAKGQTLYLATSPEFHMKRLLAAGSGPIYQVSRVFRNEEQGRYHNPEFSLLEWYRPGFGLQALMDEVAELICVLHGSEKQAQDKPVSTEKISYREAFHRVLSIDPMQDSIASLMDCARQKEIEVVGLSESDRDVWLDLLMSHCVQPQLGQQGITFVYDYPASQASLAIIRKGEPPVAERFEMFIKGVELANGYHELRDANEQQQRFENDLLIRDAQKKKLPGMDLHLIKALAHGLPDCSGVALGLDRLLQVQLDTEHLQACLSFPIERA